MRGEAFYAAAAQIIPIFTLVLLFGEGRLDGRGMPPAFALLAYGLMIMLLVCAEFAALRVLITGKDSSGLYAIVTVGLVAAAGMAAAQFMERLQKDTGLVTEFKFDERPKVKEIAPLVALCAVVVAGYLLLGPST